MAIFGYARVSTGAQDYDLQVDAIKNRYPDAVIRAEKASGTARGEATRPVLELLLDMISEGDKLVIHRLDRLARSTKDLLDIVDTLKSKGATLEILNQNIDTSTSTGRAFLSMLAVFAEFEHGIRAERVAAGVAKAKAEGKYKGRAPDVAKHERIKALRAEGVSLRKIANECGCSLSTVQRALGMSA
ncbi:recombinase family protein [Shewanella algae]|uniref:recombinase family protein n=1 Tax=Shewanella algae TaxID=38313 RepID=UPI0031F4BFFE